MLQTSILILFFSVHQQKIILAIGKSCFRCFCSSEQEFSKFTCNYWFRGQVLTSFIFEKNLSTNAVFRGNLMNIRWSSFKQLGKIITQAFYHLSMLIITRVNQEVSEARKMSLSFSFSQFISFIRNFSSLALCFSNI